MGNMEERLQTLEENVKNIQKTQKSLEDSVKNIQKAQESLPGNKEKDNNMHVPERNVVRQPVERETNPDEEHRAKGTIHNFVGYVSKLKNYYNNIEIPQRSNLKYPTKN